jgi:fructose-1,6-bisphosphatase
MHTGSETSPRSETSRRHSSEESPSGDALRPRVPQVGFILSNDTPVRERAHGRGTPPRTLMPRLTTFDEHIQKAESAATPELMIVLKALNEAFIDVCCMLRSGVRTPSGWDAAFGSEAAHGTLSYGLHGRLSTTQDAIRQRKEGRAWQREVISLDSRVADIIMDRLSTTGCVCTVALHSHEGVVELQVEEAEEGEEGEEEWEGEEEDEVGEDEGGETVTVTLRADSDGSYGLALARYVPSSSNHSEETKELLGGSSGDDQARIEVLEVDPKSSNLGVVEVGDEFVAVGGVIVRSDQMAVLSQLNAAKSRGEGVSCTMHRRSATKRRRSSESDTHTTPSDRTDALASTAAAPPAFVPRDLSPSASLSPSSSSSPSASQPPSPPQSPPSFDHISGSLFDYYARMSTEALTPQALPPPPPEPQPVSAAAPVLTAATMLPPSASSTAQATGRAGCRRRRRRRCGPIPKLAVVLDPLNGSALADAGNAVGTIFGIYRVSDNAKDKVGEGDGGAAAHVLRKGSEAIAAGYALYGAATQLVISLGNGVDGFTMHPALEEFVLTRPRLQLPKAGRFYSVNMGHRRYWSCIVAHHIDQCAVSKSLRYIGTFVADVHRTLLYGGVFFYPPNRKRPMGKLRLVYEAMPIAFLIEQAGGACATGAGTGEQRLLDMQPSSLMQNTPIAFGSRDDVDAYTRTISSVERPAGLLGLGWGGGGSSAALDKMDGKSIGETSARGRMHATIQKPEEGEAAAADSFEHEQEAKPRATRADESTAEGVDPSPSAAPPCPQSSPKPPKFDHIGGSLFEFYSQFGHAHT